jgi:hypothetical protein
MALLSIMPQSVPVKQVLVYQAAEQPRPMLRKHSDQYPVQKHLTRT